MVQNIMIISEDIEAIEIKINTVLREKFITSGVAATDKSKGTKRTALYDLLPTATCFQNEAGSEH